MKNYKSKVKTDQKKKKKEHDVYMYMILCHFQKKKKVTNTL